tara:strand:+ start:66 stop:1295 length:1230 start_codon:yes stop_codon:yes gene_type:complete
LDSRPKDPSYWHGIGYAPFENIKNPHSLAKEYAIQEISSQIKVNISSEMNIVVKDFNGSIDNAITSVIKSRVDLLLPELEFVGNFKDKTGVYFYARLNKERYQLAMNRLRENAKITILNYLKDADKEFGSRSFKIIQKAWKEIVPFTDEPIMVNIDGNRLNLYSLIKQKLNEFDRRLILKGKVKKELMKTFIDRNNSISIEIRDAKTNKFLPGVPINISIFDNKQVIYSDNNGMVRKDIEPVSNAKSFDIKFKLDEKTLFDNNHDNLELDPSIYSLSVNVLPATVSILSYEKNLGESMEQNIIEPFIKKILNGKLEFVDNNPDFVLRIESDTEERSKRMNEKFPYFVFGKAKITFKEVSNDKEFFSTQVSNIKGGDFESIEIAGLRSYDKMMKEMIPQLEESFVMSFIK